MAARAQATLDGWLPDDGLPVPGRAGVLATAGAAVILLAGTGCAGGAAPGEGQEPQGGPPPGPLAAGPPGPLTAAPPAPAPGLPAPAPGLPAPIPGQPAAAGRRALTGACPAATRGFTCLMLRRIRAAQRYLARQPGRIGVVLHDRVTGATWRNASAATAFPAASTTKLAMAADLLLRAGAGRIALRPGDWALIHQALHDSSDTAADRLWFAFENRRFLRRITRFGMRSCSFSARQPYWGFMYCTPQDLVSLMNYVLGDLPGGDRGYLVSQLRHVGRIQQWGVWGAGPGRRPGNKDGWENDAGTWVVDTVGFAGPGARYTLAIMDEVRAPAGFRSGANTLTQIAALLFQGGPGPRPTAEATP